MRNADFVTIREVRDWVSARLSPDRLRHVKSVVRCSKRLARRHGLPVLKAELAAWLHDAAKEMKPARMRRIMAGTPFGWDRWERRIPALRHGPAAAALAWKVFGIRDREVLAAIRHHTMGRPRMGRLETLLFLADTIEPGRDFSGVHKVRRMARRGLEVGALVKAASSHDHLRRRGKDVHPRLLETRDWLMRRSGKNPRSNP